MISIWKAKSFDHPHEADDAEKVINVVKKAFSVDENVHVVLSPRINGCELDILLIFSKGFYIVEMKHINSGLRVTENQWIRKNDGQPVKGGNANDDGPFAQVVRYRHCLSAFVSEYHFPTLAQIVRDYHEWIRCVVAVVPDLSKNQSDEVSLSNTTHKWFAFSRIGNLLENIQRLRDTGRSFYLSDEDIQGFIRYKIGFAEPDRVIGGPSVNPKENSEMKKKELSSEEYVEEMESRFQDQARRNEEKNLSKGNKKLEKKIKKLQEENALLKQNTEETRSGAVAAKDAQFVSSNQEKTPEVSQESVDSQLSKERVQIDERLKQLEHAEKRVLELATKLEDIYEGKKRMVQEEQESLSQGNGKNAEEKLSPTAGDVSTDRLPASKIAPATEPSEQVAHPSIEKKSVPHDLPKPKILFSDPTIPWEERKQDLKVGIEDGAEQEYVLGSLRDSASPKFFEDEALLEYLQSQGIARALVVDCEYYPNISMKQLKKDIDGYNGSSIWIPALSFSHYLIWSFMKSTAGRTPILAVPPVTSSKPDSTSKKPAPLVSGEHSSSMEQPKRNTIDLSKENEVKSFVRHEPSPASPSVDSPDSQNVNDVKKRMEPRGLTATIHTTQLTGQFEKNSSGMSSMRPSRVYEKPKGLNTKVILPPHIRAFRNEHKTLAGPSASRVRNTLQYNENDLSNYIWNYFPRSYAEVFSVFDNYVKILREIEPQKNTFTILDFGCGTCGALAGLLMAIKKYYDSCASIQILTVDGNPTITQERVEEYVNRFAKQWDDPEISCQFMNASLSRGITPDVGIPEGMKFDFVLASKVICEPSILCSYEEFIYSCLFFLHETGVLYVSDVLQMGQDANYQNCRLMGAAYDVCKRNPSYRVIVPTVADRSLLSQEGVVFYAQEGGSSTSIESAISYALLSTQEWRNRLASRGKGPTSEFAL